jgi:hypothetical protein
MITVDPYILHGTRALCWMNGYPGDYTTTVDLAIRLPRLAGYSGNGGKLSVAGGILFIRSGYQFDGASGTAVDGVGNMLAALIHDALYDLKRHYKVRLPSYRTLDRIYRDVCLAQGAGKFRSAYHYVGLRGFGWLWRLLACVAIVAVAAGCIRLTVQGDWVHRGQAVTVASTNSAPVAIDNLQEGGRFEGRADATVNGISNVLGAR